MRPEERDAAMARLLAKDRYDFADLVDTMAILRLPGGCMWDAEQTHKSIRDEMIEETYEVIEAIDNEDPVLLREELGDALLQVVFHARIEEEEGRFDIDDVISDIVAKLIHRHPHVFGSVTVESTENVLQNWEMIKTEEKKRETLLSRLVAVPMQLPALMRASKIAKKTELWYGEETKESLSERLSGTLDKILAAEDASELEVLMGEFLYLSVCLSRKLSLSAEETLTKETDRRIQGIRVAEQYANGRALESMTPEERAALRARLDELDANENGSQTE
ncbi:MAG: MazG family protein [Clostridia bacterium]|nr:MazG family protein [Clostridia bacterium]